MKSFVEFNKLLGLDRPIFEIMDTLLLFAPCVALTCFFNIRTARSLFRKSQNATSSTQGNDRRLTIAFLAVCVSWVLLASPIHVYRLVDFIYPLENLVRAKTMHKLYKIRRQYRLATVEEILYAISLCYGFVNTTLLFVMIRRFRQPVMRPVAITFKFLFFRDLFESEKK